MNLIMKKRRKRKKIIKFIKRTKLRIRNLLREMLTLVMMNRTPKTTSKRRRKSTT